LQRSANPVDLRPFLSRIERERRQPLEMQYRSLAIPEVVAALSHLAPRVRPVGDWRQAPLALEQARAVG
jgi:hypothetical protein